MRSTLHILTRPADTLVKEIISRQSAAPQTKVEVVDLTGPQPDYTICVEKIFEADSVAVW